MARVHEFYGHHLFTVLFPTQVDRALATACQGLQFAYALWRQHVANGARSF